VTRLQMNPYSTAQRAYTESTIMTASQEQLVVMLYDGAIRSLRQSAEAMRTGDRERSRNRMRSAEAIIDELNSSLDMGQGQIPSRLRSIYLYCKRLLILANVETDPGAIDTVVRLLSELRDAWAEILHSADLQPV
jgi:flagellar secretion chaperone FliS